ncbi:phage regulatory protein/antirepressor Ant [Desemzia sp. C1]|uniref:phage regulatory protein/antirepressor Ant n=1 Tax=Desemzia sp. C1 TaxID=2892016 RepID=UPI001E526541|nr:phage regulatory protein/antirepressor Ant [Desemzia sp. C1]MCI3027728.1 phage regulatory protein/antirepressor Ant [Desemzia sp. C1]
MNLTTMHSTQTIESREVARMVGKEHSKLLRDIRNYIDYLNEAKIGSVEFFVTSSYQDLKGETRLSYLITKQGCQMVANKLTGKKGVIFTALYVQRFNEMENKLAVAHLDSYMIEDPVKRAEKWIEEQRVVQQLAEKNEVQAQLIAEYEPRISYLDTILDSKGLLAISQIAADYGMSPQQLNKVLHDQRVQHKVGGQWILYKDHMNKGYTKSQTINITRTGGHQDTKMNTKWTQKGRLFIHDILKNIGVTALMDREGQ